MKKIAVVTDSTAVMSPSFIKENEHLYVIPLQILFGVDEFYRDGIDLTCEAFFKKLEAVEQLPTTSQPSLGVVLSLFEDLLKRYDQIIYITISSNISGTYQTGVLAKKQCDEAAIEVFDSLHTSVIQKFYVEEALRFVSEGKTMDEIITYLTHLRNRSEIYLAVDDLRHLGRTGRIHNVGALVGSFLKIKPILHFEQGFIDLKKKVRTFNKALLEMIQFLLKADIDDLSVISIAHAAGLDCAIKAKEMILEHFPKKKIEICELSPVISVHTGPNTVGIAWIRP